MGQYTRATSCQWLMLWAVAIMTLLAFSVHAQSKRELRFEGSEIEGTREKPKDLYILPWQGSTLIKESDLSMGFYENTQSLKDFYQLREEQLYFETVGKSPHIY